MHQSIYQNNQSIQTRSNQIKPNQPIGQYINIDSYLFIYVYTVYTCIIPIYCVISEKQIQYVIYNTIHEHDEYPMEGLLLHTSFFYYPHTYGTCCVQLENKLYIYTYIYMFIYLCIHYMYNYVFILYNTYSI